MSFLCFRDSHAQTKDASDGELWSAPGQSAQGRRLHPGGVAAEVGITQRMVAYYEAPDAQAPSHLLPQMAQALGVSVDVLLGLAAPRAPKKIATNRLERRLLEIEKLDPKAKRQITQLLDSFIEGQKLKQRVGQRSTAREARA
jgi:transcriptional regulator with XRE-family HTH domain